MRTVLILALLAGWPAVRAAPPDTYALDPVHTRVLVAVDHAGFSQALGTASGSRGVLHVPDAGWDGAALEVVVPLARLDFGDDAWNRAVLARGLLDAARHPEARFTASEFTATDATHARACGELQLHGTTQPLCLEVVRNGARRHPLPPFRRTVGFSATGALSRKAFGIDAWPGMIGDTVTLRIEAEAMRDADASAPPPATAPEPTP